MATTTTTSNSSFNQQGTEYGTAKPILDENTSFLRNWLNDVLRLRAGTTPETTAAYANAGVNNINAGADAKRSILSKLVTSRGLGRTSMGTNALAGIEGDRIGAITNFQNNDVPMYQEQMQQGRLNDLAKFVMSAPVGQETFGQTSSSGASNSEQKQKTSIWSDLLGIASYLGGSFLGGYGVGKGKG